MKRPSYTFRQLVSDIAEINANLDRHGSTTYRFTAQHRNGYTAIDLATPEQLARHCCHRNLAIGTPRECLAACGKYLLT
jgi:hypothetical protein